MNDWLHCNKCSIKFQPSLKLYLSECGHIFCEKCGANIKDSKCVVCDKPSNFIPVSKDMDTSVQQFFIPFDLQIKKVAEVYNFQMQHRMRMFQTLAQKYAFAKKECINVHNKNKDLVRENRMLKNMMHSASRNNQPFLTSTPALTNDTSQMDDISVVSSIPVYTPSFSSKPGYPQRIQSNDKNIRPSQLYQQHMYSGNGSGGIFHRPSPAQIVPKGVRNINMAAIHRPLGTSISLQELRGVGKRT